MVHVVALQAGPSLPAAARRLDPMVLGIDREAGPVAPLTVREDGSAVLAVDRAGPLAHATAREVWVGAWVAVAPSEPGVMAAEVADMCSTLVLGRTRPAAKATW